MVRLYQSGAYPVATSASSMCNEMSPQKHKTPQPDSGEMLLWGGKYGEPGIGARWEPSASLPRQRAIRVTLIRTSRFSYLTAAYKYRPNQERVKSFMPSR